MKRGQRNYQELDFGQKNLGGKINNSSNGLKALFIAYTNGNAINAPNKANKPNMIKVTINDRFNFLLARKILNVVTDNAMHLPF